MDLRSLKLQPKLIFPLRQLSILQTGNIVGDRGG